MRDDDYLTISFRMPIYMNEYIARESAIENKIQSLLFSFYLIMCLCVCGVHESVHACGGT